MQRKYPLHLLFWIQLGGGVYSLIAILVACEPPAGSSLRSIAVGLAIVNLLMSALAGYMTGSLEQALTEHGTQLPAPFKLNDGRVRKLVGAILVWDIVFLALLVISTGGGVRSPFMLQFAAVLPLLMIQETPWQKTIVVLFVAVSFALVLLPWSRLVPNFIVSDPSERWVSFFSTLVFVSGPTMLRLFWKDQKSAESGQPPEN